MPIKLLTQNIINQIAAGEVIERPASVIKELVENAIDANATEITVSIMDAGKSFISVSDNGTGMDKKSLELCILSHATSKLDSENLFDIHTFGFRGEALPSIASIARVSITSSPKKSENDSDSENCWKIQLEGSQIKDLSPENRSQGTTVEVRDLFFATPARLKFLKSNFSESENCREAFLRIAAAFPNVTLKFIEDGKQKLYFQRTDSLQKRIGDVFGENFSRNTFPIDVKKGNLHLHGAIGVPTYNRSTSNQQYFFVNNRFVKDKIFFSALRAAYSGLVPQGRYAVAVLFLDMPHTEVDVNAHPSKIEVRFRDTDTVRYFISSELKNKLFGYGSNHPSLEAVEVFHAKTGILPKQDSETHVNFGMHQNSSKNYNDSLRKFLGQGVAQPKFDPTWNGTSTSPSKIFENSMSSAAVDFQMQDPDEINNKSAEVEETCDATLYNFEKNITNDIVSDSVDFSEKISLGTALSQVHNTYIVASDGENLIIVDQHAAAERITLEKLKAQGKLDSQMLLMPDGIMIRLSQEYRLL